MVLANRQLTWGVICAWDGSKAMKWRSNTDRTSNARNLLSFQSPAKHNVTIIITWTAPRFASHIQVQLPPWGGVSDGRPHGLSTIVHIYTYFSFLAYIMTGCTEAFARWSVCVGLALCFGVSLVEGESCRKRGKLYLKPSAFCFTPYTSVRTLEVSGSKLDTSHVTCYWIAYGQPWEEVFQEANMTSLALCQYNCELIDMPGICGITLQRWQDFGCMEKRNWHTICTRT